MWFLDLTLPSLEENLALDEALLLEAEAGRGGEVLRFWEWPEPAVVLGSGSMLAEDVHEAACAANGVPIVRRSSGGGTVLLGAGCLVYTLVLAYDRAPALTSIPSSYAFILEQLRLGLEGVLPGTERAGTSDLAAGGRKFSGNAQQRKRHYLLHHGTLLYDFDLEQVGRYLHLPSRQPDYRMGRAHRLFLRNFPLRRADLERRLRGAWEADAGVHSWPESVTQQLVAAKYTRSEWLRRR